MTRKLVDKIAKKNFDKKCYFCDENNYHLLDVHRIVPGEEGGEYTDFNSLTVCANHHRLIHSGYLKIDRKYEKYFFSMGSYVVPALGENAYLELNNNFELFLESLKKEI